MRFLAYFCKKTHGQKLLSPCNLIGTKEPHEEANREVALSFRYLGPTKQHA